MNPQQVSGLVSFIGAATQLGGALLLAAFFLLLRGHAQRRPYFRAWSVSWVWMSLALLAVFTLYRLDWTGARAAERGMWLIYQGCKLVFLSCLLAGAMAYAGTLRPAAVLRIAVPVSLAFAVVSVLLAPDFNSVVGLQGPVAAIMLGVSAERLLRVPRSRSTLGSRATGVFFALFAALWLCYAAAFPWRESLRGPVQFLVQHNSFFDLLVQMLLGYGMVLLLMEDVKREVDAAHGELAVAHDDLKRLALHDSLTGVLNRRAWTEGVGMEVVRATFGAVVMLDLDNLKAVNDQHGHAAGDELLRQVAEVLRRAVRPVDRLYRWGGDEFLLLMPGARASDARRRVDELLLSANRALKAGPGASPALELSVGAAEFSGAEDLEAAVRHADAAMYEEKARRRRNRASTTLLATG